MTDVHGEARMLIDGELVDAGGGRTYDNINPATEESIGPVADAEAGDVDRAVGAARRAFDETDWSTNHAFRKQCLQQLKDGLEKHKEELRPQLVGEVGCPIGLTFAIQQDSCIEDLQWDIDLIDRYQWDVELPAHEFFGMRSNRQVWHEAIGVVGAITPWNFPFMLNLSKLGPALAAGCTVVLKPAPDTPYAATFIGKIVAEETDIPAGVVNVVTGSGPAEAGEIITGDPRVDMISFTGSTAVGKRIAARSAETLKRVFLELGGKSANIVLDDADFSAVLPSSGMVCMHSGQGCAITTRMLLPRARYDEGVEIVQGSFETFPYGDPNDFNNMAGPLVNRKQYDRVLGYIQKGKDEGARCLVGGGAATQFDRGYFVQPTLFADVDMSMTIAREEIFGPVLVVIPYEDDDDAVRIANDTRYGLSGAINGGSLDRAKAMARRIRTGTIAVNGGQWFGPDSPFGGYKESGSGREHGIQGFEEYLETKTVGLPASPHPNLRH
jgi:aldehyde dehydrogenase (NAD+)